MSVKQNFPTIKPTLNLDFANSKAVDSRITFTRASAATVTNAQGILQTVRDNKPRIDFDATTGECRGLLIEEQRTNLLSNSSDIVGNSNWSLNNCLRPIRASVISPSGLMDAYKIMENSANTRHETNFTGFSVTSGNTYVATVYAKAAERNYLELAFGGYPSASFNLNTGVAVANGTQVSGYPKMTAVGNGWYRCEFAWVSTSTDANMSLYMGIEQAAGGYAANQGSFGYGLYIWGAQIEQSNFSTSYIPTTTIFTSRASSATYQDSTGLLRTAPVNGPRYSYAYDSTTGKWVAQGLLLESSATNILVDSDLYGNTLDSEAIYTKTNNSTDVVAPNGTQLTTKLVTGTTGNSWYWRIPSGGTFATNTTYTISVWIRCATGTTAQWSLQPYPYSGSTLCNITDQWQRFSVTFTTDGSGTQPYVGLVSPSQSRTFYVWGWQAEQGSVATSYIPTYGATATRSADVSSSAATTRAAELAYLDKTNFSSWYNALSGTAYAEYTSLYSVQPAYSFQNSNGSTSNHWTLSSTSGQYSFFSTNNGNSNGNQNGTAGITAGIPTKVAVAVQAGNAAIAQNGNTAAAVTNFNTVPVVDRLVLTATYNLAGTNAYIKKFSYYPQRVSNTQLQALTV